MKVIESFDKTEKEVDFQNTCADLGRARKMDIGEIIVLPMKCDDGTVVKGGSITISYDSKLWYNYIFFAKSGGIFTSKLRLIRTIISDLGEDFLIYYIEDIVIEKILTMNSKEFLAFLKKLLNLTL